MTAKEEKIIEAWGKIGVNLLMGVCMKTGYSEVQNENDISKILEYHNISKDDIEFEYLEMAGLRYRPKSLQGIENNNGWLPYVGNSIGYLDIVYTDKENIYPYAVYINHSSIYEIQKITRYQTITIPEKPIY